MTSDELSYVYNLILYIIRFYKNNKHLMVLDNSNNNIIFINIIFQLM